MIKMVVRSEKMLRTTVGADITSGAAAWYGEVERAPLLPYVGRMIIFFRTSRHTHSHGWVVAERRQTGILGRGEGICPL